MRIYEEARGLIQAGHNVTIVTYHIGRNMPDVPTVRIRSVPWYSRQEAGPSWHKPYLDLMLLFKAFQVARNFKPHIIHAHLHEGVAIGFILKKLLGIPLIFDYQGSLSDESLQHGFYAKNSFLHKLFINIERILNSFADYIVTSSTAARDNLVNHWKISKENVTPFIDGVDMTFFKPHKKEIARQKHGIPSDVKLIVYLGILNQYQGVDLLLEALCELMAKDASLYALIMGFPEKAYKELANELHIGNRIIFTGKVAYENAAEYLSAGDVAVSPKLSDTEANGKLFNYMACALPTVVFDTPINREILGDTGFYVTEKTASALAVTIKHVLGDCEILRKTGIAAYNRAKNVHSWQSRIEIVEAVYGSLIA